RLIQLQLQLLARLIAAGVKDTTIGEVETAGITCKASADISRSSCMSREREEAPSIGRPNTTSISKLQRHEKFDHDSWAWRSQFLPMMRACQRRRKEGQPRQQIEKGRSFVSRKGRKRSLS
ncbi:hypothetical protein BaRGS_00021785, partial [Batillaria attramentaria]